MATKQVLKIIKSTGGTSDQACAGVVSQVNELGNRPYTVCGSLSFCVEYKQLSTLNTAVTQVVTVALLVLVEVEIQGSGSLDLQSV